jgi:tRNA nucleotidyltransferase (CCA-adding enzyme)
MALRLSGTPAGELIDPHGGRADLHRRQVRVLHDASFRDDATRVLRALRYAVRLQFGLAPNTKALLARDLSYLDTISGARFRHEFERIAREERAGEIVRLASDLGVLAGVHPALRVDASTLRALEGLPDVAPTRRDAALFCLLLAHARRAEAEAAMSRLSLTGRQADAVRGLLALREEEANLARPSLRPSEAADLLRDQPLAAIEVFALITKQALVAERVRRYLGEWRFVRPRLNGSDVEALSVPHGPQVGIALASLRAARLDGQAQTRDDEVSLIRRWRHIERLPVEARDD